MDELLKDSPLLKKHISTVVCQRWGEFEVEGVEFIHSKEEGAKIICLIESAFSLPR